MPKSLNIKIADVSIAIEGHGDWDVVPAYAPFVAPSSTGISLRLNRGIPDTQDGQKVFDCPPIWTLHRHNDTSVIKIFDHLPGIRRTLILPRQSEIADLYFADESNHFVDPFFGPTMELLMVKYLAEGRGAVIHGCGVAWKESGILFVGESGAGKSTLASLWDQDNGAEVLSDDRTIVRKRGDEYWIYGTPWHGEAAFSSPRRVPLQCIFFLRHGRENFVKDLKGKDPVSQLLTCSFPPLWDSRGMDFILELFTHLAAQVTCHELSFTPERSVLDFVKDFSRTNLH